MKWLLFIVFFCTQSFAQDVYYVSHVQGKVKKAKEKNILKLGQALTLNDSLVFNTHKDYVCLMSPVKGSRTARYEKDILVGKRNEFIGCLKDMLFPSTTIIPTAGRSGIMNSLFDFENYLRTYSNQDMPLLVIDSALIDFGPAFAANPEKKFFYAQYLLSKQRVNKKINFRYTPDSKSIQLAINDSIYLVNGKLVDQYNIDSVKIYYYDGLNEQHFLVGNIKLKVERFTTILNELCVIKAKFHSLQKETSEEELRELLYSHITNNFGIVNKETIDRLLKTLNFTACK